MCRIGVTLSIKICGQNILRKTKTNALQTNIYEVTQQNVLGSEDNNLITRLL